MSRRRPADARTLAPTGTTIDTRRPGVCALSCEARPCAPATTTLAGYPACATHAELASVIARLGQTGALMPKCAPRGARTLVTRGVPSAAPRPAGRRGA